MQFSDTSTRQGLIQDCEDLTGIGATGISGTTALLQQFTRNINAWYHKVVTMILASQGDWEWDDMNKTNYPVGTINLVAGQRDYVLPLTDKILKVKRIDITYDGTSYIQALPLDSFDMKSPLGSSTQEDAYHSKIQPYYDLKTNSVWLYPLPDAADVAAGAKMRIEFLREPTEFATNSTTAEPGFDEPFHRMLSIGASLDYAITFQKPNKNDLKEMLADYELRLREYYSTKHIKRLTVQPRALNLD